MAELTPMLCVADGHAGWMMSGEFPDHHVQGPDSARGTAVTVPARVSSLPEDRVATCRRASG